MIKVNIKPLSVNSAWIGRRWPTKEYSAWTKEACLKIPKIKIPEGELELNLIFGVSNRAADIDNPQKTFIDALQKRLGFDDKRIYRLTAEKVIVKKGEEFIQFNINQYIK